MSWKVPGNHEHPFVTEALSPAQPGGSAGPGAGQSLKSTTDSGPDNPDMSLWRINSLSMKGADVVDAVLHHPDPTEGHILPAAGNVARKFTKRLY